MKALLHAGGRIESVAVAGDALLVEVSGIGKRSARTYDLVTGELRRELLAADTLGYFGHSVAPHPDGRTLFTTYRKGFVDELDLATGERLRSIELPRLSEEFPGDGGALYVTRAGAVVYVFLFRCVHAWDRATDTLTKLDGDAFAADPRRMVASHDETVAWTAYHELARYQREPGAKGVRLGDPTATDIAFLASSDRLAVVRYSGKLEFWTPSNPPEQTDIVRVGPDALYQSRVVAVRGGALAAVSCADHCISVVGPGDVAPRARIEGPWAEINALGVSGETVLIGDDDGRVWKLDMASKEFPRAPGKKRDFAMTVHDSILDMAGVTVGDALVTVGGYKISPPITRDLCVWKRGTRDAVAYRATKKKLGYETIGVAGNHVLLDDGGNSFIVVDATTLKTVATLAHKKAEGLAVSPDGTRVVTTSATEIKMWSATTWQVVDQREGEVPRKAVAWLEHDNLVVFLGPNGSFGTFSATDLKRRATKGLGSLETLVTDPRVPVVACVVDIGKPGKPDLALRLWNIVTDTVISLPALRQPAFAAGGVVAIDAQGTELVVFELDGRERKRIPLAGHVNPGHTVTLFASGDVAVVRSAMETSHAHPWSAPPGVSLVNLTSGAVSPQSNPAAGDLVSVMSATDDAIAVTTTAGRVEWLPLAVT